MKNLYILSLALLLLISCGGSGDDTDPIPEPKPDLTGKYVIPITTRDTVLFVTNSIDNIEIPIYISLPKSATEQQHGIVVMHGSGGNWKDEDTDNDGIDDAITEWELSSQNKAWKGIFDQEGVITAFPGSYYRRGTVENAGDWKNPPLQFKISASFIRNYDAYLTLETLRKLVRNDGTPLLSDKVALLGFSHGASAIQSTLFDTNAVPNDWEWTQYYSGTTYSNEILPPAHLPEEGGFVGGVMYYPGSFHNSYYGNPCNGTSIFRTYADFMIHLPSEDGLTDNSLCMIETVMNNGGGMATVHEYEGANHSFDNKTQGTDGSASTLARSRSLAFLKEKLGIQ